MLIVTGSVTARRGHLEPLRQAALDHVGRSRAEDGCLHHSVQVDCEHPLRLFFYERWRDLASLQVHFAQPGTAMLLAAIREHGASSEAITMYEAEELPAP